MNNVAAVVVTHNNAQTITGCLKSIQAVGISHIVVVDNNSTDITREKIAQANVTTVSNSQNVGFAQAANQGAQATTEVSDYILFLNPDAFLPREFAKVITYIEAHPTVAVVGCQLCSKQTNQPERWGFGTFPTLYSLISRKFTSRSMPTKPITIDWVSGGCMVVRKEAWQKVGGFDPTFFLYWEDVDLCYRLKQVGYETVMMPDISCAHEKGQSLKDAYQKARLYDVSAGIYMQKHYPSYIWGIHWALRRLYRYFQPRSQ